MSSGRKTTNILITASPVHEPELVWSNLQTLSLEFIARFRHMLVFIWPQFVAHMLKQLGILSDSLLPLQVKAQSCASSPTAPRAPGSS